MCDDTFGWWFRLLLNVTSGAMFGWAYGKLRSAERVRREIVAMRARVDANLTRSTVLLGEIDAFAGHDDDPPDPPLH